MYNKVHKVMLILCILLVSSVCSGCYIKGSVFGGNTITYDDADKYSVGDTIIQENVTEIEIDWIGGNIDIVAGGTDDIELSETSEQELNDSSRIHYYLEGSTLHIKFCASGFNYKGDIQKDVTLRVPEDTYIEELDVNMVSSDMNVSGIGIEELSVCTVSGSVAADVKSLHSFDVESVSGNLSIASPVAPDDGDAETVSGDVELTIPENKGFKVELDSVSGNINSEIAGKTDDDSLICGDGSAKYDVNSVSGNVNIRKYESDSFLS